MIDLQKDITLVLGIDAKTIEQLRISWPTWKKNREAMWDWPIVLFYDSDQVLPQDAFQLVRLEMDWQGPIEIVEWPPHDSDRKQHHSQRYRMLAGHVYVPGEHCRTKYFCKLDTDSLAKPGKPWPDPEWFHDDPVVIASRWGYTKGEGWLGMLEEWGDCFLPGHAPLGCRDWPNYSPTAIRVGHARWCSWCSLYRTDFVRETAALFNDTCGRLRLPVPSQDSSFWYVAERMKLNVRIAHMKSYGFNNHPRIDDLRRVANEIMNAQEA